MCVGHCKVKPSIYKRFIKKIECILTNAMLKKMDFCTYTKLFNLM